MRRRSCRTASSSTGASGSPGTTTSTSTPAVWSRGAPCSERPRSIESGSLTPWDWRSAMAADRGDVADRDGGVDREEGADRADGGDIAAIRTRARTWLAATMPLLRGESNFQLMLEDEMGTRARELQRILFDGGFAGLYFPKEYGGQGLPAEYQTAFNQESAPYEMPVLLNVPSFAI